MKWLILALVLVAAAAVAVVVVRRSRSAALRRRFGPEYDRAVAADGDRRVAEANLRALARRRATLDVRPLTAAERSHYEDLWRTTQARFVDVPGQVVAEADALVSRVLQTRGYPVDGIDEQVAMVAVDHGGDVAQDYRRALDAHGRAGAASEGTTVVTSVSTDDLRAALLGYRTVFHVLVGSPADTGAEATAGTGDRDADGAVGLDNAEGPPSGRPDSTDRASRPWAPGERPVADARSAEEGTRR